MNLNAKLQSVKYVSFSDLINNKVMSDLCFDAVHDSFCDADFTWGCNALTLIDKHTFLKTFGETDLGWNQKERGITDEDIKKVQALHALYEAELTDDILIDMES